MISIPSTMLHRSCFPFAVMLLWIAMTTGCGSPSPTTVPKTEGRFTFHIVWDDPPGGLNGVLNFFADDGVHTDKAWLLDRSGRQPNEGTWISYDNEMFNEHPEIVRLRVVVQRTPFSPYEGELAVPLEEVRAASFENRTFKLRLHKIPHKTIRVRFRDKNNQPLTQNQQVGLVCAFPDHNGEQEDTKFSTHSDADGCVAFCLYNDCPEFPIARILDSENGHAVFSQPFVLKNSLPDNAIVDFPWPQNEGNP